MLHAEFILPIEIRLKITAPEIDFNTVGSAQDPLGHVHFLWEFLCHTILI